MLAEPSDCSSSWECEGAEPCPLKLESPSIKPRRETNRNPTALQAGAGAAVGPASCSRKGFQGVGMPSEVRINILPVLCCSSDKTKILGFS